MLRIELAVKAAIDGAYRREQHVMNTSYRDEPLRTDFRIALFADVSRYFSSLILVLNKLGITAIKHPPQSLHPSAFDAAQLRDIAASSLVLWLVNEKVHNSQFACTELIRLRCPEFDFGGSIVICAMSDDIGDIQPNWLKPLGIQVVVPAKLITCIMRELDRRKDGVTLPNWECRPTWAFKAESLYFRHRTRNAFNIIGNMNSAYLDRWMADIEQLLLPTPNEKAN